MGQILSEKTLSDFSELNSAADYAAGSEEWDW